MLDINELRKQPHLSASSLTDYVDCGLMYKLSRIDKFLEGEMSESMVLGKAIHKVFAEYNHVRMTGGSFVDDDFQESFELNWKSEIDENKLSLPTEGVKYDGIRHRAMAMIKSFEENPSRDEFKVLAIEEAFIFNIEGLSLPIIGAIDLVEEDERGTLVITDYKTTNRAFSEDQVNKSLQMTVYQMAALANGYSGREILLRFDCFIKTKKPRFEQCYTTRSDEDMKRTQKKIMIVWDAIQKGVFIPNDSGWKCNYCRYKKPCAEWFKQSS